MSSEDSKRSDNAIKAIGMPDSTDYNVVPKWITEDIFINVVREVFSDFNKVTKFVAYPALAAGENYSTVMLRINIDVELKDKRHSNLSLMFKLAHDTKQMREILERIDFFATEVFMYTDIMPEYQQMYKEKAAKSITFAPKLYKLGKRTRVPVLLLEDLRNSGFRNVNRLNGLDVEHTEMVLKKLAAFHAASTYRCQIQGAFPAQVGHGFYGEVCRETMKVMIDGYTREFCASIKNYQGCEHMEEKIVRLQARLFDEYKNMAQVPTSFVNVLNHGDCWSNNIMFKYDGDGKVLECYFVDFQNPTYYSPVFDLYYLIITSVNIEHKLEKFDYFIRYYYDHFVENLKALGYEGPRPRLTDLHIDLLRNGPWAYTCAANFMTIVLADPTDEAKFDNLMSDTADSAKFKRFALNSSRYRANIERILPWLDNRGLLD